MILTPSTSSSNKSSLPIAFNHNETRLSEPLLYTYQVRINETNLKTQVKQLMDGLHAAIAKTELLEREREIAKREQSVKDESKSKGIQ